MPPVDNLDIQISTSLQNSNKALDDIIKKCGLVASSLSTVSGTTSKVSSAMAKTTMSSTKSFNGLTSTLGRAYANIRLIIRGMQSLYGSVQNTADYIESFNYYTVAMGKVASKWDKNWENYGDKNAQNYSNSFVKTMNETFSKLSGVSYDPSKGLISDKGVKNLGLNIKEITQYAAQLTSMMDSVGQNGEVVLATTDAFTRLAGDISSLYNIDYSSAATNIRSVLMGQSRAGYKFGWDTTVASLQAMADSLNLGKAVSEMTQMEKQQLRILKILQDSRVAWGDQANTINNLANQIRLFKNNLKEVGIVFGQLFAPLFQKVLPYINGVTIAIKRLLTNIAGFLGIKFDSSEISSGFNASDDAMTDLSDSLDNVAESAKKAKSSLRGFDELKTINMSDSASASDGIGGGIDLTDEILKATSEYEKVWQEAYDKMEQRAQDFADNIERYFKPIEKLFQDIKIGDWFAVGEDVSNIVSGIFNFFSRAIESVDWYGIGNNIGLFLAGLDWTDILSSLGNLFWTALNAVIHLWKGSFDAAPIETGIITAVALLSWTGLGSAISKSIAQSIASTLGVEIAKDAGIFTALKTGLLSALSAGSIPVAPILAVIAAITALAVGLGNVYSKNEEVRKGFSDSVSSIKDGLQPAFEFFSNTVIPNLNSGWERMKEILSPLSEFLNGMFTSIWLDVINPALSFVGEQVLPKLTQAFENLWKKVLVPLGNLIGDVLTPVVEIIAEVLTSLWQNIVIPLAGAVGNVLGKAFDGLVDVFNYVVDGIEPVITILQFLWNYVLEPIVNYLKNSLKPVFETVFETIGGIISGLGTALGGVIDFLTGYFTGNWKKAWNGIVDIFKGIFNGIISIIEGVLNLGITGINNFLKRFEGVADIIETVSGKKTSVPQIKKISIPRFEVGGFPDKASLFWANENGIPELVGTMGGQTAVASGTEITGIKDAILQSSNRDAKLMERNNQLLSLLLEKEFDLSDSYVGKKAQRFGQECFNRTGDNIYCY